MNNRAEWTGCNPVSSDTIRQLLTRYSVGPKHLINPAPSEEQILLAACAALRAPDHEKLLPFRFVLIADEERRILSDLFADFARRCGKSADEITVERERAMRGPALIAFVARIEPDHSKVPPHEQWLAAGGALANFLMALHLLGYAAKVLSGRKAADVAMQAAFCEPGETLVGWIAAGTASKTPHPREDDNPDAILRRWQSPMRIATAP